MNGHVIRLVHVNSGGNMRLHSHSLPSPNHHQDQNEVTVWGGNGDVGDPNDLWLVLVINGERLLTGRDVRLIHHATNGALHSHPNNLPAWGHGQGEVTSYLHRYDNDLFGFETYIPRPAPTPFREFNFSQSIGATRNYAKVILNKCGNCTLQLTTTNSDCAEGAPRIARVEFFDVNNGSLGSYQIWVDAPPKGFPWNSDTAASGEVSFFLDPNVPIHTIECKIKMNKSENIDWLGELVKVAPLVLAAL